MGKTLTVGGEASEGRTRTTRRIDYDEMERERVALLEAKRDGGRLHRHELKRHLGSLRRGFSTGWGLFYDKDTGETLGKDTAEVVKDMVGRITESPAKKFQNEIRARAAQIDAEALTYDSCYDENPVDRVKKLRIAYALLRLSEEYESRSGLSEEVKDRVTSITNKFKDAIESELHETDAQLFAELVSSTRNGLTAEDRKRLEEFRDMAHSEETEKYFHSKLKEKRKMMIEYTLRTAGVLALSAGLWGVGTIAIAPAIGEALHGVAAILGVAVVHQANRLRLEWVKMKTVLEEMSHRFRNHSTNKEHVQVNDAVATGVPHFG